MSYCYIDVPPRTIYNISVAAQLTDRPTTGSNDFAQDSMYSDVVLHADRPTGTACGECLRMCAALGRLDANGITTRPLWLL